jgi:hypothetical protein
MQHALMEAAAILARFARTARPDSPIASFIDVIAGNA